MADWVWATVLVFAYCICWKLDTLQRRAEGLSQRPRVYSYVFFPLSVVCWILWKVLKPLLVRPTADDLDRENGL